MKFCPICAYPTSFDFQSKYVLVNRCENPNCRHHFATNSVKLQGVYDTKNTDQKEYSVYKIRNINLIDYLRKLKFIDSGYSVLDFGAGNGHILQELFVQIPNIEVTAVEFNSNLRNGLMNIGCSVYKTIKELPSEAIFDSIFMIEVIEHLDNPIETLTELKNRLKPDGKLFLTTPAGDLRYSSKKKKYLPTYHSVHHVQFFTEQSLKNCLLKAGFTNTNYKYVDQLYLFSDYSTAKRIFRSIRSYLRYFIGRSSHLTYFIS